MTDAQYLISLIDKTFEQVPEVRMHHERLRKIAAKLETDRKRKIREKSARLFAKLNGYFV